MGYDWVGYVFFAGIALLFLWAFKKDKKSEAKRSKEFGIFAQDNGWLYADSKEFETLGLPEKNWFSSRGTSTPVENVLEWEENSVNILVFRYHYINKFTSKTSWGETVLVLKKDGVNLPWFRSWPKKRREDSWWHKGWENICTDVRHVYFKNNIVKSKDKDTVEKFFTREVLDVFARFENTGIEALDDYLIFTPEKCFEPDQAFKEVVSKGVLLMNTISKKDESSS